MSNRGSTYVGIIVSILIIGAVGSIGYYQLGVAPNLTSSATTSTSTTAACTPATCIPISIMAGASSPPSCYPSSCTTNYLYGYSPTTVTLVLGVNNTVIWTNNDNPAVHTATSSAGDPASWDSGCIGSSCPTPTTSYAYTFTVAGTYYYHCDYHAWMEGEIVVMPASSSASSSPATATTTTLSTTLPASTSATSTSSTTSTTTS